MRQTAVIAERIIDLRHDIGKAGPVIHDFSHRRQKMGQGKGGGDPFDPLGRAFNGKPDFGQKHHGPGNKIQDPAGEFLAAFPGMPGQAPWTSG